jgi:hypothetical protein
MRVTPGTGRLGRDSTGVVQPVRTLVCKKRLGPPASRRAAQRRVPAVWPQHPTGFSGVACASMALGAAVRRWRIGVRVAWGASLRIDPERRQRGFSSPVVCGFFWVWARAAGLACGVGWSEVRLWGRRGRMARTLSASDVGGQGRAISSPSLRRQQPSTVATPSMFERVCHLHRNPRSGNRAKA